VTSKRTYVTRDLWEGKTQSGEIGDPVTMLELISLLRTLARLFRDRRDLMVENLLLRHQLHVALSSHPRPDLKSRNRFLWLLVRSLYPDWKQHLILVQPETCRLLTRQGWRLYWRWRSGRRLGRPRLSPPHDWSRGSWRGAGSESAAMRSRYKNTYSRRKQPPRATRTRRAIQASET
jgi:hypothetical protein